MFDALYEKRPDNFSLLVKRHVRFSTFFPLQAAIKRGIYKGFGPIEMGQVLKVVNELEVDESI